MPVMRSETLRRLLLVCGILAPLLYAAADAVAGLRWEAYSFRDQTISELGAIGAPSRPLFAGLLLFVYLLLAGFGIGVWQAARGRSAIRMAGALILGFAVLALTAGQAAPMMPRGIEQGIHGTLHLAEGAVAMLAVLAIMGFAACALGSRFRLYTIATVLVVLAFGAWSAVDAPRLDAGLATPWLGVRERIFWYAYHLWFAVLAIRLLRPDPATDEPS
ncbi:MAG: DUF998 domain-containing protein [Gammaproteobacteria bacterium]|nr:DUF998 domain-containing protein [Gammaproteobacteria bacterium]